MIQRSGTTQQHGNAHEAPGVTSRGQRFVLVIDRDGVSVTVPHGRRIALWFGSARRRFGRVEIFTPRKGWL